MEQRKLTAEDAITLRKRVEYEDQLLNSRTGIVLTLNGLMAVATSLNLPPRVSLIPAAVIILVNIFWLPCALDAYNFIRDLTRRILETETAPMDEQIRREYVKDRFRLSPTSFISIIVPGLLLAGWILGLVLTLLPIS